jgi:hypothetical protein
LAIVTASGIMANADEFGATTGENTVHTYLSSIGLDRPSAVFPRPVLCPTGMRVPT